MNRNLKRLGLTFALAGTMLAETVVPDGTPIKLRLNEPLSSGKNRVGQGVSLSVAEDVVIGDKVVIEAGAKATGQVTVAEPHKTMGRGGKLDFTPEKVQLPDGHLVAIRATQQGYNGKGRGLSTGLVTAGIALVFWPAAPFALMIKGKDIEIPPGVTFTAFTDAKFVLSDSPRTAKPEALAPPPSQESPTALTLTVDSDSADIELDGAFVGQTPAKLNLTAGRHRVVVKGSSLVWERTMQFEAGSSVTLKAHVAPEAPSNALARAAEQDNK